MYFIPVHEKCDINLNLFITQEVCGMYETVIMVGKSEDIVFMV